MSMLRLLEAIRRLWFLFLAFFRFKSKEETPLPVFSKGKTRLVGKPEPLSPRHERRLQQRGYSLVTTCGGLGPAGSEKCNDVRSSANPNIRSFYLPLNRLPSNDHQPPGREFSTYSLILPDQHSGPPPRPPRPRSISVGSGASISEDEFKTPVICNVNLPAVIVTPCTPSTEASKTGFDTSGVDELDSEENGELSGSDTTGITSVDSNLFWNGPSSPLNKELDMPILGALNYRRRRARSLTGTGRGLQHQLLSQRDSFNYSPPARLSSFSLTTDAGMLSNPVKQSDVGLLLGNSVTPSANETSAMSSKPNSEFQAITHQRIRSYITSVPSRSTDQLLPQNVIVDTTIATTPSALHSGDQDASAAASGEDAVAALALMNAVVMCPINTPSNSTPTGQPSQVPYPEVFDLDTYFDSDSSQSTLQSFLNSSCSTGTTESTNPCPILATASPISVTGFVPPSKPLRRISDASDTTASSTSIYALSSSNASTDTDESNSPHIGSLYMGNSRRGRVTFDRAVSAKRYRDQYRPPGYSRSPAFVVESHTTSRKKFIGKRESDAISIESANKENEIVASTPILTTSIASRNSKPGPSSACPRLVTATTRTQALNNPRHSSALLPVRHQHVLEPASKQVKCPSDFSTAGKTISILGSVAIAQRRKMDPS